MLLEASQQRGQAGSATDRHDPRAASEEPLLVDDLHHGLVPVPEGEWVDERPHQAVGAEEEQGQPGRAGDRPAHLIGQELEREEIDDVAGRSARPGHGGDLAQHVGHAQREHEEACERHEEPPLDADADGQPAAQVHRSSSRWKTETDPKSRSLSRPASSSLMAMERWKPPVQPMAIVRRVFPSST